MEVLKRSNDALNVNFPGDYIDFAGGIAQIAITVRGSDWYWTVTAVMMVSALAVVGLSFTKRRQDRVFHYISALLLMVASVAYFSMASNLGWTPTTVEFMRSAANVHGRNRQVFYVRYIDWVITTPLLLLDLLLTAGLPWPTILYTIILDEIMICTGLVGALTRSSYKWGYYTFGCMALLYIGYILIFEARSSARALGSDVSKTYLMCGTWTFALWCLYPIAWGVCEGGNVIPPDSEAVFYGVLDIFAKPGFTALLLWGHRNIEPARLGLTIHDYSTDATVSRDEKAAHNNDAINGSSAPANTNSAPANTNSAPANTNSAPAYTNAPGTGMTPDTTTAAGNSV